MIDRGQQRLDPGALFEQQRALALQVLDRVDVRVVDDAGDLVETEPEPAVSSTCRNRSTSASV